MSIDGSPYLFSSSPSSVSGGVGPGPTGPTGFTDGFSIAMKFDDSVGLQGDDATYDIAITQSDTNSGHIEEVSLKFPAGVYQDASAAPTEQPDFTVLVWLTGSAGSGVTNPTNADGGNNGTTATIATAPLSSNTETMTSNVGVNVPGAINISQALYRGWFSATVPLGSSDAEVIARSSTGLFADIVMHTGAGSFLDGSFTYNLFANGVNTIAKIQSVQIIHTTSDLLAGTAPATINVDAGAIQLTGAFS